MAGKSLSHLMAMIPPTNPDTVADSCSDGSDDEAIQPKPLCEVENNAGPSRGYGGRSTLVGASRYSTPPSVLRISAPGASGAGRENQSRLGVSSNRVGKTEQRSVFGAPATYYTAQWRKPQTKKHKTWDGDAFIKVEGARIWMFKEDGDLMGNSALVGGLPGSGTELRIGGFDLEIDSEITEHEFKDGTTILNKPSVKAVPIAYAPSAFSKPFRPPSQTHQSKQMSGYIPPTGYTKVPKATDSARLDDDFEVVPNSTSSRSPLPPPQDNGGKRSIAPSSFYSNPKPKPARIVIGEKSSKGREEWGGAMYNPNAEGAVVMKRPPEADAKKRGLDIIDVVVDPYLSSKMRAHQKEGVKFMYSCVMGLTEAEAQGCILADEMGLGKTLQTIALIHTLLTQSPFSGQQQVIGKALVVCPVSLVENWKKEFTKWLGSKLSIVAITSDAEGPITGFLHNNSQRVLIIGYEKLRKHIKKLASCQPPIDLIVCDEGHRLKSKDNKTTKMFEALRTRRRIILSGTPVQNDLGEYFSMVDFTCPGLLSTYPKFVKYYEKPIIKSRTPGCSEQALEEGKERAEELGALSKEFVLRRTANVLDNYLPPKHEYVVFVAPSIHQLKAFGRILDRSLLSQVLGGDAEKQPLAYIDLLRKIANTPTIMRLKKAETSRSDHLVQVTKNALADLPTELNMYDVRASGKLFALDRMLHSLHENTDEKVVIVSNFTSTLNIIAKVCEAKRYPALRLDGSTPQKQRLELVDRFNRGRRDDSFIFLLSAKAGGVGLNLIGASRLILFDSDWNPSTDLQAMARIHRDGQKRPVYIYRFLTTNSIDEKIYQVSFIPWYASPKLIARVQRQITKTGLADQMMDHNQVHQGSKDSFTSADLRDIFSINHRTDGCQTHDLLLCDCAQATSSISSRVPSSEKGEDEGMGSDTDDELFAGFRPATNVPSEPSTRVTKKAAAEQRAKLAALKEWSHIDGFDSDSFANLSDTILYNFMWEDWRRKGPLPGQEGPYMPSSPQLEALDEDEDDDIQAISPPKKRKIETTPTNGKATVSNTKDLSKYKLDSSKRGASDIKDVPLFDSASSDNGIVADGQDDGVAGSVNSEDEDEEDTSIVSTKKRKERIADSEEESDEQTDRKVGKAKTGSTKTESAAAKKKAAKVSAFNDDLIKEKKYNVLELAEQGQAGRVMFVFEKISASKM